MMRRLLFPLLTSALLAGCGTGLPAGNAPFEAPAFTLAAGWASAPAATLYAPRASSLVARKAGGFVLAYDTQKHGGKDVFVVTSSDGERWSAPVSVGQTRFIEEKPALVEDAEGKLHLIYASNTSGTYQLYASTSSDGKAWDTPAAITAAEGHAKAPALAVTPTGVALAYQDLGGACHVMRRSLGGEWGPGRLVDVSGGMPALAHDGEGLRVIFHRQEKLFESVERAGNWSKAVQISGAGPMREPALARIAGKLSLAYSVQTSRGTWQVATQVVGPSGWGQEQVLVEGPDNHGNPALAEGPNGGSWLAWGISRLTEERAIFVARSGGR